MKRILLTIAMLFVCSLSYAQLTTTAREGLFEPSNKDYDDPATRKAIHEQQSEYKEAKDDGNFDLACKKALFNSQLAWLCNNKAIKALRSKPLTTEKLDKAIALFQQAIAYCNAGGAYADERKDCKSKATKSMKWAEKEKARLEKAGSK